MHEDIAQRIRQALTEGAALRDIEIATVAAEPFVSDGWAGTVYKLTEEINARLAAQDRLLEELASAVIELCERGG